MVLVDITSVEFELLVMVISSNKIISGGITINASEKTRAGATHIILVDAIDFVISFDCMEEYMMNRNVVYVGIPKTRYSIIEITIHCNIRTSL